MKKKSFAIENFKNSIAIAETLLIREKRFKEPLKLKNFKIVQGLRGGALVLMVGSFEYYLIAVMEERLNELSASHNFNFSSLPENIIHHNQYWTLYHSLNPHKIGKGKLDTAQKIFLYEAASQFVTNNKINPEAFSLAVRSNPKSEKVAQFFNSIGSKDFFTKIKPKFDGQFGRVVDIRTMLDEIIGQRHQVAHSAIAINLSRYELGEDLRFLTTLAEMCDEELFKRITALDK